MQKISKIILPVAIIVAAVIIGGVFFISNNYSKCPAGVPKKENVLSSKEVADKVINYVNENLLRGRATASLIEVLEENGFYKINFEIGGNEIESYATREGKFFFPEVIDLTKVELSVQEEGTTIGGFSVSSDEICKENNKPIVYFFGSQTCPHCTWEHPIIEEVAAKFEGYISFHNNMDSEADGEIFQKYSTGGIPTLVLGCKYYRVGSGEAAGKEQEIKDLITLICQLTNNQPAEICQE